MKKQTPRLMAVIIGILGIAWFTGCTPPGQRALLQGERLLNGGKYDRAAQKFRRATELLPENAQAWNHLGLALHHSGNLKESIHAYTQALNRDPTLTPARFNLGEAHLALANLPAAIDAFSTFTVLEPENYTGWMKLASAQARMADSLSDPDRLRLLGEAAQSYESALRIQGSPQALNALAVVQIKRGRPREALPLLHNSLRQQPDYAPALLNLAVTHHQHLDDGGGGLELYRRYLALNPRPANWLDVDVIANRLETELKMRAERAAAAATLAATPPEAEPEIPEAPPHHPPLTTERSDTTAPTPSKPVEVASVLPAPEPQPAPKPEPKPVPTRETTRVEREPESPATESSRAPETSVPAPAPDPEPEPSAAKEPPPGRPAPVPAPTTPDPVQIVTPSPAQQPAQPPSTQPERASPTASAPVHPEQGDPGQRSTLRGWFSRTERTPIITPLGGSQTENSPPSAGVLPPVETIAPAETATRTPAPAPRPVFERYTYHAPLRPRDGDRDAAYSFFAEGLQAQRRGRHPEAVDSYRQATQRDPAFFEAWYNLGLAAFDAGQFKTALFAYEYALAIQPASADARFNFARALQRAGHPGEAANELQRLIKQYPDDPRSHLTLANVYSQQLHDKALARSHYQRVLELDPRHPQATAIRYWMVSNP